MATIDAAPDRGAWIKDARWILAVLVGIQAVAACVAGIGIRACRDAYARFADDRVKPAVTQFVFNYAESIAIVSIALAAIACLSLFLSRNYIRGVGLASFIVAILAILVSAGCLAMCLAIIDLGKMVSFMR